uniref:Uncharacterized protein n=1 Tax=Magallana gigas TaxID=29159 RepID=K1PJH7_MAGGI
MKKRKMNLDQISTKEFKKRRVELKKKSSSATSSSEIREGVTYESAVLSQTGSIPNDKLETIPSPPEQLHQVPLPPDEYNRVYFDLETTGLDASCEITQMAARCGDSSFCQYVLPSVVIQETASRITGLTCDGSTLYKNGVPVQAVSIQECLTSFHEWLNNTPGIHKPLLFAHNCRKFDSVVLCRAMRKCPDIPLQDCIIGFCDTLPMLKDHASCNTTNSTLETLVLEILGCTFEAHNALEDCTYLQKLVEHHSTDSYYLNYTFSMDYMMQVVLQMEDSKSNLQTLMPLLSNKTVSESMVKRMSLSGLSMHHLQLAYQRGGFDGVQSVLSECFHGKPRVTKRRNIITSVVDFLKEG